MFSRKCHEDGHVLTSLKSMSLKAVARGGGASTCVRDTVQSPSWIFSYLGASLSQLPTAPEKEARQFS